MTTRLGLYNSALREVGERKLASLSENRAPRRALDSVWDDNLIRYCLEQGLWNFAMRTIELEYSPSVEPSFGYQRAFDKPEDFVRTAGLCTDEYFKNPLLQYSDEAGFWFTDLATIYVRYVSDDNAYGNDLSLWPESFTKFVYTYMAAQIVEPLTQNASKAAALEKKAARLLVDAKAKDAMAEPTAFLPTGSWVMSRRGGGRGDRGNRGSLIG